MLSHCLINEFYKLKRSGVLWLATAGSVLTNLMFVGTAFALTRIKTDLITDNVTESWETWVQFHYKGILPMLLPMYLVILCALAVNQEKRLGTWKTLAIMPVAPQLIYISKLFAVSLVFAVSHLIFVVLLVLLPYLLQFPLVNSALQVDTILLLWSTTILTSLGTIALVYLISYLSRNFVLPLAVGILGFVLSQLLHDNAIFAWYLPFALPVEAMDEILSMHRFPVLLSAVSLGFFVVCTFSGIRLARTTYPRE